MDYIPPERSLDGTGDPMPLFGDQGGNLLEHTDYHGEGVTQQESPVNQGPLVDPGDHNSYLAVDSLPFLNDHVPCNTVKSDLTSPSSPLKQDQGYHMHMESDIQNDAAEQNVYHNESEALTPSTGYAVHKNSEVVDAVLPPELHESSGNDTSNFQQETTHFDAYLGNSLLAENSSSDYQLNNSGVDDDEIPNSSAPQMENDRRKLHVAFQNEENETEDDQMNGDELNNENFNSAIQPSYFDEMEQVDPGMKNGISNPGNSWDSPPERSAGLDKSTPSPDRRVSLSPHAHSSERLESQHTAKEDGKLPCSQSPPARRCSRSPEKHDINHGRAPSRELSPRARDNSPRERKARRESRHGNGSPRRRSPCPRRKDGSPRRRSPTPRRRKVSPRRRSASPRRKERSPRRRSPSPRRRASPKRRGSPRRRESSLRKRDSPTRKRDRSKSRSPSRKVDASRHRREHGKSRSRSPHTRDHHKRSPRRRHSPRRRSPSSSNRHHSPRRPWSPPANRKTGLGKPGRNLFVAGFSYATTERDLEKKFARFGRVISARVVRDKRSGDSRGFGFLSLERDEDADEAIHACDETEWNGRIILVEKSKAPTW